MNTIVCYESNKKITGKNIMRVSVQKPTIDIQIHFSIRNGPVASTG